MKKLRIALVVIACLGIAPGTLLFAGPSQEYEITFFSDAAHTTVVGWMGQYCNYRTWWGQSSRYFVVEYFSNCDSGGEPPTNECVDGYDNDSDGSTDSLDSNCAYAGSVRE